MRRPPVLVILAISMAALPRAAVAAASCKITVTAPASFGNYNPFNSGDTTTVASLNVTCTSYTGTYTISLAAGTYGTIPNREMAKVGATGKKMSYELYQDAAHAILWGNGTNGQKLSGSCSASCNTTYPVYGDISAGQNPVTGSYTSSVTATLTY